MTSTTGQTSGPTSEDPSAASSIGTDATAPVESQAPAVEPDPLLDLVLSTELIPVVPAGAAVPFTGSRASRHRRPSALVRFWRRLVAGLRRVMRFGRRKPPVLQPLSLTMGASGVFSPQAYEPSVSLEAILEATSGSAAVPEPPTYAVNISATAPADVTQSFAAPAGVAGDAALTALREEVSQLRDEIRSTLEGLRMQQQVLHDLVASVRAQEYLLQHRIQPSLQIDLQRLAVDPAQPVEQPVVAEPAEVSITMPVVEANTLAGTAASGTAVVESTLPEQDLLTKPAPTLSEIVSEQQIDLTRDSEQAQVA